MGRLILVDAYNALFRLRGQPPVDPDEARRWLVTRAQAALAGRGGTSVGGARVVLVFDTRPGAARAGEHSRSGSVAWVHVRGSADEEIVRRVRAHEGRVGVVVVSDDQEVRSRSRQLGARVLGVQAFFGRVRGKGGAAGEGPARERGGSRSSRLPPLTARDFGLPEGPIDLGTTDPDAL